MFGFIKKCFFTATMFFGCNVLNLNWLNEIPMKSVSMNNQECKIRPKIININSDESLSYSCTVKISKCSGSCNNINDPYAKLCVPDVAKNINAKVFRNWWSKTCKMDETCKCKCRLDASVCYNKQCWNNDKCRCEDKELIDECNSDKGFIWNFSNCDCECDKSCDIGEYLDCKNCRCRNKLVDELVEECSESSDGNDMIHNNYGNVCNSCTIYIVLFVISFLIIIGISTAFVYFHWYLKSDINITNINPRTETVIY